MIGVYTVKAAETWGKEKHHPESGSKKLANGCGIKEKYKRKERQTKIEKLRNALP